MDANGLLEKCDRTLIELVGGHLLPMDSIDSRVMARLLYGSAGQHKKLEHVKKLVEEIKEAD